MTYREANKIMRHNRYLCYQDPTAEELREARNAFGIEHHHSLCITCGRRNTCEAVSSWNRDKVVQCNFYKAQKEAKR